MFCSISNERCIHPVISKKTGDIFEKSLLEKHLKMHNTCPITSEPMTMADIIPIRNHKLPSPPKQLNTSSIPLLLNTFQNEWDELMLESYNSKKKLQDARQQLSHSMYQYDAAIRVIARLTQERDRALQELANTKESMASALSQVETMKALHLKNNDGANSMDVDKDEENNNDNGHIEEEKDENKNENKLSEELISKITLTALDLAKVRKKESKKPALTLVSMDIIHKKYSLCNNLSYECHSTLDPGINCIALDLNYPLNPRVMSGGNDSQIIIYNQQTKEFEYVLKGHNKRVNDIKPLPNNMLLSASSDYSCIVWQLLQDGKCKKVWNMNNMHKDCVLSLSRHPMSDYFLSCSRDGLWCFNSLAKQESLLKIYNNDGDGREERVGFNTMELHPDGQILATGCNNKKLKIWDIRTNQVGYTFSLGADGDNISCINFNENGYYLGCGHLNGVVNIWDLRKIGKNKDKQFLKKINVGNRVKCIRFDPSGQYLAIGQPNGILLYLSKKWNKFAQFKCQHKDVTAIQFAKNAKYIITASRDRNINVISNNDTI